MIICTEYLLYSSPHPKHLRDVNSSNPHDISVRLVLLSSHFIEEELEAQWGHEVSDRAKSHPRQSTKPHCLHKGDTGTCNISKHRTMLIQECFLSTEIMMRHIYRTLRFTKRIHAFIISVDSPKVAWMYILYPYCTGSFTHWIQICIEHLNWTSFGERAVIKNISPVPS